MTPAQKWLPRHKIWAEPKFGPKNAIFGVIFGPYPRLA